MYTEKLIKREDLNLSVLTTTKKKKKKGGWQEETFGGDRYIYYLDCGDGFTGVCIYSNPSNCLYYICVDLCIKHTLIKSLKKKIQEKINANQRKIIKIPLRREILKYIFLEKKR